MKLMMSMMNKQRFYGSILIVLILSMSVGAIWEN